MSNHVHLVVPRKPESLAKALKYTHGRYASYWNATHGSSGHAWQGRFYSCPLDQPHLLEALRYAELNPVRAGLIATAELWPWSSAGAHCGTATPDSCLEMETWRRHWSVPSWRQFSGCGRDRISDCCSAPVDAYRTSAGNGGVRRSSGANNST